MYQETKNKECNTMEKARERIPKEDMAGSLLGNLGRVIRIQVFNSTADYTIYSGLPYWTVSYEWGKHPQWFPAYQLHPPRKKNNFSVPGYLN